jgi:hypothetical protein
MRRAGLGERESKGCPAIRASGHGTLAFVVLLGLGWLAGFLWF